MSAPTHTLRTRNDAMLARVEPYLVALPDHWRLFDTNPFALRISPENLIDPTHTSYAPFCARLATLDRLTFGTVGMPMPKWIACDCSAIPGAIFGFGIRAETLTPAVRTKLELDDNATGLVPLSQYIAVPVRPPGVWCGHNLASLNSMLPELQLAGLASITKGCALKAFRCTEQMGATQWDSKALGVHTRLGPMELLTAWTPAHDTPASLTYRLQITDTALRAACGDPDAILPRPEPSFTIDAHDHDAMQRLQKQIEAGERFAIPYALKREGDRISVPIAVL